MSLRVEGSVSIRADYALGLVVIDDRAGGRVRLTDRQCRELSARLPSVTTELFGPDRPTRNGETGEG